jgi:GNAT superfamily N-acetyltransferase
MLEKNLFSENPFAQTLIAEWDNNPAGFALYYYNFSTFLGKPGIYLEDLFVKPDYRGLGIGKSLLRELARLAAEQDCGRLDWAVLDWNEPAINFYKKLGAEAQHEWTGFRLSGQSLHQFAEEE